MVFLFVFLMRLHYRLIIAYAGLLRKKSTIGSPSSDKCNLLIIYSCCPLDDNDRKGSAIPSSLADASCSQLSFAGDSAGRASGQTPAVCIWAKKDIRCWATSSGCSGGEPVSSVGNDDTFHMSRILLNLLSNLCPLSMVSSHRKNGYGEFFLTELLDMWNIL